MSQPTASNQSDLKVVYVISVSHSGSTLLDLLISSHSTTVSVGEAKRYSPSSKSRPSCACKAPSVWECPFWQRVDGARHKTVATPALSALIEVALPVPAETSSQLDPCGATLETSAGVRGQLVNRHLRGVASLAQIGM